VLGRRGVPRGYRHDWGYRGRWREVKVKRGEWRFRFDAVKSRGVPAKAMGSVPVGGRVRWRVSGVQTAVKVNRNQYRTRLVGVKRLVSVRK